MRDVCIYKMLCNVVFLKVKNKSGNIERKFLQASFLIRFVILITCAIENLFMFSRLNDDKCVQLIAGRRHECEEVEKRDLRAKGLWIR